MKFFLRNFFRVLNIAALPMFACVALSFVGGCGVQPAEQPSGSSSSSQSVVSLVGQFSDTAGNPYTGVKVIDQESGAWTTTDANGISDLELSIAEGQLTLVVETDVATAPIELDAPRNALVISYEVRVDEGWPTLLSAEVAEWGQAGGPSNNGGASTDNWTTPTRCLTCHQDKGAPQCQNDFFVSIHHPKIWDCSVQAVAPPTDTPDDSSIANDEEEEQEDDPSNGRCTRCHSFRGSSTNCSSDRWAALHPSFCPKQEDDKDKKKDKDKDKNKDKDKDKGNSKCTACHEDRGSNTNCGDARWKALHPQFCSSGGGNKDKDKDKDKKKKKKKGSNGKSVEFFELTQFLNGVGRSE